MGARARRGAADRTGPLMVVAGLAILGSGAQEWGGFGWYAVGNLIGGGAFAVLAHLLFTVTESTGGRLDPVRSAIVGLTYAVAFGAVIVMLAGGSAGWSAVLLTAYGVVPAGVLGHAWWGRPDLRRAFVPVVVAGAAVLLVLGARMGTVLWPGDTPPAARDGLGAVLLVVFALWPLSLLGSLVHLRLRQLALAREELVEQVRAARARTVAANDTERRRFERDLHDGAQQRLAALLLLLAGERTGTAWRQAREEVLSALAELREIAHAAHPALLVEAGLGSALHGLAERSATRVEVHVAAGVPADLPQETERGLYFAAAEALANADKHARARRVLVTLSTRGAELELVVADDGVGGSVLDADSALADRAAALGGRLVLESPKGGGTRVLIRVPIPGPVLAAAPDVPEHGQHPAVVVRGLG
ncbi:sensor histidine kinase [Embleya sp. NBC_00888]|uniref:sensor histidine kinase n=1 Tax=Embleya sp. NBC_00888 TaxID=2975960 RepID=UPI00386EA5FA